MGHHAHTSVDPLVLTTSFTRDAMGRVTSTIYADTYSESFLYNSAGLLDYHLDKNGCSPSNGINSREKGGAISLGVRD